MLQKDFKKLFQHWQLVLFLHLDLWEMIRLFGKGINIPKKYFPMLPMIVNELTQPQIDKINRVSQTGGFLGTLASIGIPMAISIVSKMFGGGLQVDKTPPPPPPPSPSNVYLPQAGGQFTMYPPPFYGNWNETVGAGKKTGKVKKKTGKGKKKEARDCC